jgi:hypothetical protein
MNCIPPCSFDLVCKNRKDIALNETTISLQQQLAIESESKVHRHRFRKTTHSSHAYQNLVCSFLMMAHPTPLAMEGSIHTHRPARARDQGDWRRRGPLAWWWMGSGPVGTSRSSSAPNPVVLTSSSASCATENPTDEFKKESTPGKENHERRRLSFVPEP